MKNVLICGSEEFSVPRKLLVDLHPFDEETELLGRPYKVQSTDDSVVFGEFLRAIKGEKIEINSRNISVLRKLSSEFGFSGLSAAIAGFDESHPEIGLSCALRRAEKDIQRHERSIESLFEMFRSLDLRIRESVDREVSDLRSEVLSMGRKLEGEIVECKTRSEGEVKALMKEVQEIKLSLRSGYLGRP